MFWIGMIVGIVVAAAAYLGYLAWCCKVLGVTKDEFLGMSECIAVACTNRESTLTVVKDYEDEEYILTEVTLKEK